MNLRKGVEILQTSSGEQIQVKKSPWFGWGIVYPWKNEDGSINWKNLISGGHWSKLIITAFIVFLILMCILEYSNTINLYNQCIEQSQWRIIIP